jgi:hypothetical protein
VSTNKFLGSIKYSLASSSRMMLLDEDNQSTVKFNFVKSALIVMVAIQAVNFPQVWTSLMVSSLSNFKDGKDRRSSSG